MTTKTVRMVVTMEVGPDIAPLEARALVREAIKDKATDSIRFRSIVSQKTAAMAQSATSN
jgi:hypothetical protein